MSCGRRLPGHCRSPVPGRRVVGCMTSSRLFSPPRRRPCSRPPRPQLSRSRHANFWPRTKGSAPAARGGRARLSHASRPAHTPLAGSARVAGGSPPLPAPPQPLPRPGSPLGSPGARGADYEGGGRGRGLQRAPPGGEGAEARIGGRGGEGGASQGWGKGLQLIPHPPSSLPPHPRE